MKVLMDIFRRMIPQPTLVITEPIPSDEPVVFVANHEKNYGPAMMQLFFPVHYRPWIIYNMLDEDVCQPYVQKSFFEERLRWPVWLSKPVAAILTPPFGASDACYQSGPRISGDCPDRIVETFRQSIKALENGDNLLIFPEKPEAESFTDAVNEFFEGFLYLAKLYYRKRGKHLLFCPVSINPKTDTISVGKMVRFNSDSEFQAESKRIRNHLMAQVAGLYHQPWLKVKMTDQEIVYQSS